MIRSFYLRLFFLGLPGLYLALWLSRFSFSMVNAMPYYYGMLMTALSIFSGMLIGFTCYNPFHEFFRRNYVLLFMSEFIFLAVGHLTGWMDAGITAKYEIIYYFAALCSIGFCCSLCMQYNEKKERRTILAAFLTGSVLSYFIGIKYFEDSQLDIYLGIPVFAILLLNMLTIQKERSWIRIIYGILLSAAGISILTYTHIKDVHSKWNLSLLGYVKIEKNNTTINIQDHKKRTFSDVKNHSMMNAADLLAYQLQTGKSKQEVLFIGYPGSITPVLLYQSPFIARLDMYFWDMQVPKGFPRATVSPSMFYRSEWDFLQKFKKRKFDLIIIENIPEESTSSRRIFLHYAKRLLKEPYGVIAYPENIARKYDGQYIKINSDSNLVMLMGSESTENSAELEKRYDKFIKERTDIPSYRLNRQNIPVKMITNFDASNSVAPYNKIKINTILSPGVIHLILWCGLGLYLVFRLFKCRYRNNQNNFFAFEAGFTFSIILFSSLMLLSELRLVYPYFSPALFGISVMVMMPCRGRKTGITAQIALIGLLVYMTSINFVRLLPPIYILPVLLPLCFIAIANTLENCKLPEKYQLTDNHYIFFSTGVILTMLLLIFAKDNNLYPAFVYISIISRILYYLKI